MSATQDFVALDWIRGEITQTLEQAQQALEAVAEAPDDSSSMRSCLTSIHQVHGTLKMVELSGPTQLAAEMEELAQALMNKSVPDVNNAEEVLMQSILQMQAYLDRIHREQQDRPGAIVPIVNDMRLARGEEPIAQKTDEGAGAQGTLALLSITPEPEVAAAFDSNNGPALVPKLRQRYQRALVALLKRQEPRENLNMMAKVFSHIARLCGNSPFGYLAQLNIAVIEGILAGGIRLNNRVSDLMKRMDRELKRLSDEGAGALGSVAEDLAQALFDLAQTSTKETPRIRTVRELFETRVGQEAPSVSMGPDDETLGAVARILKDEFNQITDKLDLYVRASERNPGDLVELLPMLEQISSTMSVVGLTSQQETLQEQVEVIRGIEQSNQEPDEEVLLDMARALLQIESLLGSMAGGDAEEGHDFGDLSEAQASVIRETRSGLAKAKDAVIEFVSTEWDHEKIANLSADLRMLRGGLQIVNQQRAADILLACAEYVDRKLIEGNRVPDLAEMDDLADAITSIDYYLERLLESSSDPYLQMIEVAEQAVAKLGFDVDEVLARPEAVEEAAEEEVAEEATGEDVEVEPGFEVVEPDEDESSETAADETPVEFEELAPEEEEASADEVPEEQPAEDVPTLEVDESAKATSGEESLVDDEIVEIFVEESEGVLQTIRECFPRWRDNPGDGEALTEVRRAFHTLKGSGRMVGATVMGELAWAVENMLNQVIEGNIEPDTEVMALISEVVDRIPEGVNAFRQGTQDDFDVEPLMERARVLAEREAPADTGPVDEAIPEEDVALEKVELEEVLPDRDREDNEEDELDELFLSEAEEHLQTVRHFLDDPSEVSSGLVAAFHTLKGSAGMAGIESISGVAAPLEALSARLHQQREIPGQGFVALVHEGVRIMEEVMADLDNTRHDKEGLRDFVLRAEAELDTQADMEESRGFDFEHIRSLANPEEILRNWDGVRVEEMVSELSHARDQALVLGYDDLLRLVDSLLRVYEQLSGEPVDEVIDALQNGHERLVIMFDEIAASQDITPAPDVIERLEEIDLGALETDKETQYFLKDCWETLGNLDAVIRQLETDPGNLKPVEQVSQHLSTLEMHAESRQASGMISLLEEMIRLCEAISAGEVSPGKEEVDLLHQGRQSLVDQLEQIRQHADAEVDEDLLAQFRNRIDRDEAAGPPAQAAAGTATKAEPSEVVELPPDEVDEDILPIFLEEVDELLENIDQSVLDWSNDTGATEYLDNLLRHLHTLKGGSRMAGLASLGEYTHNIETWLIGVKNHPAPLDEAFFALLNRRQDEITRRVEIYKKLAAGEATNDELESLKTVVEGSAPAAAPARKPAEPEAANEVVEAKEAETPAKTEPAKTGPASPPQEVVRVSADLLDSLISLVGESSITRARVEQQISDFSTSLDEMEQTINRIRDQVRRLEIETESRETLIRARDEREGDSPFDELEMDRYTLLQEISRALSESASDMLDLKETLTNKSRDAETLLHQQARISTELQEGLTRTTMVPFARLIPRLRRIVRQVSTEIGKSVRFDAYNVEGELDRTVLERIVAPLEHMLRNAVDHGIEIPEDRKAANKPETGRISLRLSREGAYVVLTISDDGAGIDVDAIRKKAIERGLMAEDSPLSDHDVMQFIMHAGLSTAKKVTQISGRGVGMDVVDSELKQLGGSITIDSTLGVGTEFTVRLPFTVSINRALMVVVGEETFAVPLNTIEGVVRVSPYELEAYYEPDAPMFEYAGQPYRLMYMGRLLDKSDNPVLEGQIAPLPVLLARSGDNAVALQVDRVIGSREVVVKSLGPQFSEVAGVSGATVLGDGSVVVILDVMALVRNEAAVTRQAPAVEEPEPSHDASVRTVMIVDDSVTVRKVTSRLMERQGWEVVTAKDGVEAVNRLQEIYPDIMLLDIEMPRMDGFEVLRTIRRDDRLKDLPVIMITSRTGEKHKQQAMELGVNSYLGKPFQEAILLSTIEEVLAD